MSEFLEGKKGRKEILKEIIKDLHRGKEVEEVKDRFEKLVRHVSPEEISEMERSLMDEGIPVEEVRKLCDVHVQVFKESLEKQEKPEEMPGHPVHTYMSENREIEKILGSIQKLMGQMETEGEDNFQALMSQIKMLSDINNHYLRKENQLFPVLEEKGVSGPTQVMWGIHDEIRAGLKEMKRAIQNENKEEIIETGQELMEKIAGMIYKEENILLPLALEKLKEEDWVRVKEGEEEIGFAFVEPGDKWKPSTASIKKETALGLVELSRGGVTPEQIDLILRHLPVDITFVDENDRVRYYTAKEERIFPRSPGIIGRDVKNCHPPDSVHVVEKIVQEFKEKTREKAQFWIQMGEKFVFIQYFPLFDAEGNYRGVIETTQEVSGIKELQGEKRLLD